MISKYTYYQWVDSPYFDCAYLRDCHGATWVALVRGDSSTIQPCGGFSVMALSHRPDTWALLKGDYHG